MMIATPALATDNARLIGLEQRVDRVALAAAIVIIPLIFLQRLTVTGVWGLLSQIGQWVVWSVFLVDLVVKYRVYGRRLFVSRAGLLGVGIIIATIPLLSMVLLLNPDFLGTRILRTLVVIARIGSSARRVMDPSAFPYIALAVLLVVMIGGMLLYSVELQRENEGDLGDAIWWAVVTISTVGYGDIAPSTNSGRAVAVVVILVGAAFMSLLTAQMAAYLSRHEQDELEAEVMAQLRIIDERTEELATRVDVLIEEVRELTSSEPS